MNYRPSFDSMEATPFELAGNRLIAFAHGDRVHTIDRDMFELLFRPVTGQVGGAEPEPILAPVPVPAAKASPKPKPKALPAPSRSARPKPEAAESEQSSLDQYPVELRDPRASSLRFVHDALLVGPAPLGELVKRCQCIGWADAESGRVMGALCKLRDKRLARKQDEMIGGDWILV